MASLNPNLKDFWIDENGRLRKARVRCLHGGRASSKSWEYAGRVSQIGQKYKTRVLCVRRFQNKIKESVYTLIKNQIDNFNFQGYNVMATGINHENGTEMVFYGIERNIDEIKSFEGADILWIEEAHNLTKEQWDILEPTIRKAGSEIWVSFNPRLATDFAYQHFVVNPPPNSIIRQVNYDENPFLSDTLLEVIRALKIKDIEAYNHIYKGQPLSDDDNVLIRRAWIDAAIDLHNQSIVDTHGNEIALEGDHTLGYDVADSGDDANATVSMCGSIATACDEWKANENELNKSALRAMREAQKDEAMVIYDSIGVGAHTGSTMQSNGFNDFAPFNAGGKVHKPGLKYNGVKQGEYFSNIKAQAWWLVADRFRNTYDYVVNGNKAYKASELISLSSSMKDIEKLITELSTPKRDFDSKGRVKVESKDDLKKRGIASPNKADAFIMAASAGLVKRNRVHNLSISGF